MFCLCPREPVGPAGLCVQVLGRRCRCGPWQAARPLTGQSSRFGLESLGRAGPLWDWVMRHSVRCFGPVGGAASLCSRCSPTWGFRCGRPSGVSCVGPQFANLRAQPGLTWALGCLSRAGTPGVERGGAPGAVAAAQSSPTSPWVPLFSFSSWEILPIQAPLVQTSTWLLTAQPGPLPRLLQQPLRLGWRFCRPSTAWSRVPGPGDLIVLQHSSYHQIFQCPLSLVSDLHICWNTVGCSLCSSDQLGISLALRGSGLRSHLCCRHLPMFRKIILMVT